MRPMPPSRNVFEVLPGRNLFHKSLSLPPSENNALEAQSPCVRRARQPHHAGWRGALFITQSTTLNSVFFSPDESPGHQLVDLTAADSISPPSLMKSISMNQLMKTASDTTVWGLYPKEDEGFTKDARRSASGLRRRGRPAGRPYGNRAAGRPYAGTGVEGREICCAPEVILPGP